jgi:hypothetical protein
LRTIEQADRRKLIKPSEPNSNSDIGALASQLAKPIGKVSLFVFCQLSLGDIPLEGELNCATPWIPEQLEIQIEALSPSTRVIEVVEHPRHAPIPSLKLRKEPGISSTEQAKECNQNLPR